MQLRGYYDAEAPTYDGTRGGHERATRAAAGFARLLGGPRGLPGPLVEVGVGTGAVSAALTEVGLDVAGLDISLGMLRVAATRLPGRVFQADGRDLPLADASCGAVLLSWVLHLVPDAEPLVAEAARVLAPGGVLVSTVDKSASGYHAAGRHVPAPGGRSEATDAPGLLDRLCAVRGLEVVGETTYELSVRWGRRPTGSGPGARRGPAPGRRRSR